MTAKATLLIIILITITEGSAGILYPQDSETRQSISLNGLWDFALAHPFNPLQGYYEKWNRGFKTLVQNVQQMPVPSSYNDISTSIEQRDHVGIVWYQRRFFVPKSWAGQRVWLRFSSVCYAAEVWINGQWAVSHVIGHLPFQADVSSLLNYGQSNIVVVSVDNTLLDATIPQGSLQDLPSGRTKQAYTFDFFNYAGIDRPVTLYTTPNNFIDDLTILTQINNTQGIINYNISVINQTEIIPEITLLDVDDNVITNSSDLNGHLIVENATFWWPYLADPNPGYLYTFQIELFDRNRELLDIYRQSVGIRIVTWTTRNLLINNKAIYLRGFGRHEDSDIRGKGLDLPLIVRDYELIKWIGANAYRTSHYPYAEEIMDLADQMGIMIIDECPAVNSEKFSGELLLNHKQSLTELVNRDKNRPSVIMWSVSNEPRTYDNKSDAYFGDVVNHVKSLDASRPVTIVNAQKPDVDHSAKHSDIVSFNLYQAWYEHAGDLDVIVPDFVTEAKRWHEKHNKPVLLTEYGADTMEGLHLLPNFIWSEEFQVALLSKHFEAFDQLISDGFFIGEMIWNFADFKTAQTYTRVGGNKKGIFTRNRQPKASAYLLRKRYWALAVNLDNATFPKDINEYIYKNIKTHDEL